MNVERKRPLEFRLVAFKTSAQTPLEFGIAGFPNFVPHMNPRKINIPRAKRKPRDAGARLRFRLYPIDPTTLFRFLRFARIEHDTVARLKRRAELYLHPVLLNPEHFT